MAASAMVAVGILLMSAPVGAGVVPGVVLRAPYSGSLAVPYHKNTTVGCGGEKEQFTWNPTRGVGGFSEKGRAWICPRSQGSGGSSQGYPSSSIIIGVPLTITTTRTYHIEAHVAITVAMPESFPAGNCLANTSGKAASCDVLDLVYGHLYGAISPNAPNSTPYYAQTDLADFDNDSGSYSVLSAGKWTYSNYSSTSRTSYSNLTYFANVTLTGKRPYFLDLYLVMDASADILTSNASLFGDATAAFNASTGGNHLTLKWVGIH